MGEHRSDQIDRGDFTDQDSGGAGGDLLLHAEIHTGGLRADPTGGLQSRLARRAIGN